jgi:hypothetical protein
VFELTREVSTAAAASIKYAIIGIFCFGFILEPVALVKAVQAKRELAADHSLRGAGRANVAILIAIMTIFFWMVGLVAALKGS